jgi:hypothetical protein
MKDRRDLRVAWGGGVGGVVGSGDYAGQGKARKLVSISTDRAD